MYTIYIPEKPIAQPRQRFTKRGAYVRAYTPAKHPVNAYKKAIKEAYNGPLFKNPTVSITFMISIKSKKLGIHTKKPDLDNLAKSVLDALNGIAWADDSNIHTLHLKKVYSNMPAIVLKVVEGVTDERLV
jgi:Holliday junction resolvase RusA-like endonuclease